MSSLYYALGVIVFALALIISIGLHELGHMIPAKAFGAKVSQYFVGFGPTVWSRQKGETEYGVKSIPLGGYVKIVGMLPPEKQAPEGEVARDVSLGGQMVQVREVKEQAKSGLFTRLISDARAAEWESITPEDEPRLFYRLSWWKKVVVMAGGPSVNILIAFFLLWGIFAFYGNPTDISDGAHPTLDSVSRCVIPASANRTTCKASDPASPAYAAGLRPGDQITTFNGVHVTSWTQLRALIRGNENGKAVIGYLRDGRARTTTTNTTVTGVVDSATNQTIVQAGFLGVTSRSYLVKGGPIYTVEQMGKTAEETASALVHLPARVWGVAKAIAGVQPRDPNSPVSIVGGGRIAGEGASDNQLSMSDKIAFLLSLIAGFNFFIGAFNFIPLLPLDGGHIASALWEAVRRGVARLRGRPDPGFVDAARLLPVAYVAASVMLVMSLVLIVGDLVVPVHLT